MADSDPNKNLNPGDRHWDDKFGSEGTPSSLHDMETSGSGSGNESSATDDYGNDVRDKETTDGTWANNVTGKSGKSQGGLRGFGNKAKVLLKKKGATAAIIALLGGGAAVPFFGAASLPFSIIGNMDAKSMMQGLDQYSEDYLGFRMFRGTTKSVSTTASKIKGLSDSEVEKLKANGVEFEGGQKNPVTRKTTFTAVKYEGKVVHAGAEFNSVMRSDPAFRSAMLFEKGSYWKSAKSAFAAKVKSLYKIDSNPDIDGKTTEEKNKRMIAEASEGVDSNPKAVNDQDNSTKDKNGNTVADPEAGIKEEARKTAGAISGDIDKESASIADGKIPTSVAEDVNMGNIGSAIQREGYDLAGDATKSLGGKIWSYVNPLAIADTACTIYSVANTANVVARTVVLFNMVRFAMNIRAIIERAKAGDDNGKDTQYLMSLLQLKDPTTGQSFDESSYAAFLFNGQLSSEPSTVSAFGGQAMIGLYMTMHAVNSMFGQLFKILSFGTAPSGARAGKLFLKDSCGIVQNVGVQIAATVGGLVIGFFTGGASEVAEQGATEAVKIGFKEGVQQLIKSVQEDGLKAFTKDLLAKQGEKLTAKAGEDGLMKYAAKSSWSVFKKQLKSMSKDPFLLLGLLAAGAGAFGMGYIVSALSGGDIAGMLNNGMAAFDGLGTGWNQYESTNGIASGGNMATYAQATAYQSTQQEYENSYVADMKYQAKDTPFDLTTPYSTLGAALFGMQKTIGVSASMSLPSTLLSVMSLPFKLPSMFTASADTQPTPEAIGQQVDNPFFQDNKIATTTTGSPQVVFQKHYSFQDILDKLVDNSNPQVSYDGNDPTTGDPKLSIIPGTDLDNYAQACHNPDKTEADPEFWNDDGSNAYDTDRCVPGGSTYDENVDPLYDDAIRFIGQVSPEASDSASDSSSTDPAAGTSGRDDVPAKFKEIATACIKATGKACTSMSSAWLGMLPGQCASFGAWRAAQQWYGSLLNADGSNLAQVLQSHPLPHFGSSLALGNGNQVAPNLIAAGMATAVTGGYKNVQPGDIVSVRDNNPAGHVFVILSNNNGVITIEDYNAAGGPGKYGTKNAADWSLYSASNIVAIARVHKGGGEK